MYCSDWNYTAKCSCNITDPDYKNIHLCKVCDSHQHPMLHCAKRRYHIPSMRAAQQKSSWLDDTVLMIETVLCCGTHNFVSAQVPVPTSFDLDTWNTHLHNYDDNLIVQHLRHGWPISYQSDVLPSSTLQNHSSAVKNNLCLLDYLELLDLSQAIHFPFHVSCIHYRQFQKGTVPNWEWFMI